jgi:hypothetical protein
VSVDSACEGYWFQVGIYWYLSKVTERICCEGSVVNRFRRGGQVQVFIHKYTLYLKDAYL